MAHSVNEELHTKMAAQAMAGAGLCGDACGTTGPELMARGRSYDRDQTLLGRIQMRAEQADREKEKGRKLHELAYLLEKNPEVARILELLEQVQ